MTDSFDELLQRSWHVPAIDPLTAALCSPAEDEWPVTDNPHDAIAEAAELTEDAARNSTKLWQCQRVVALAVAHPETEMLQHYALRLIKASCGAAVALGGWRAALYRFPDSTDMLANYLELLRETVGPRSIQPILESYIDPSDKLDEPVAALRAACANRATGYQQEAVEILERALEKGNRDEACGLQLARWYIEDGDREAAHKLLGDLAPTPPVLAMRDALNKAIRPLERYGDGSNSDPGLAAIKYLAAHARELRQAQSGGCAAAPIGAIGLIGSTLGGGGAERQLVTTALGLHRNAETDPIGPVSVYCRKLDRRRKNDFFLPALEGAGIRVVDYLRAPAYGGNIGASVLAGHRDLVDLLPDHMREGTARLTELLRNDAPDIVQIWQDGTVFAAGLAAALAGIQRIILNVRTLPPSERADRDRAELFTLYQTLLAMPGVSLTSNSSRAARAYESWLDLPNGSVMTVRNGVDPLPNSADEGEQWRWHDFDRKTGHGFVLGGIMRLDDNKRPIMWVELAARLAKALPAARFILVGSGPLRNAAEDRARHLGIGERILFTGRTAYAGYWLDKMDAIALTSIHEGMPNALIEAQLAGIPVITTPAGGASEAVAPADANLVLADAHRPNLSQAVDHLKKLAMRDKTAAEADSQTLARWAGKNFSVEKMIARTRAIFAFDQPAIRHQN